MRFDLVFSYWIFAWFLLYIFGMITYNPKLWLIIALIVNFIELLTMIFYSTKVKTILYLTFVILFFKLLPFYLIRNTTLHLQDIIASLLLFFIYIVWLYMNHTSVAHINKDIMYSLLHGTNKTPMISLLEQIFH